MKRLGRVLAVCMLCWTASPAQAQVAAIVYDPTNFGANFVTSAKSAITAAQMVISVENQLKELLPLDEIVAAAELAQDLAQLAEIVVEAEGLSFDLQSLNAQIRALFDLETAPNTRQGLDARLVEIKRVIFQARTFAARTQTLLFTIFRTVDHATKLINSIEAFAGAKQGMQTLVQVDSNISKTLAVMEVQQAASQRADVVERLSKDLIIESLHRIDARRWESWPRP